MKTIVKRFVTVALISFAVGCVPMIIMWYSWGTAYTASIPGCKGYFDYLAVKYGDTVCLPLLNASLFCACYDYLSDKKIISIAKKAGIPGGLIGTVIQITWILPAKDSTSFVPGNWTFGPAGSFNAAGWYHAVFFILELAFIFSIFAVDWYAGTGTGRSRNERILQLGAGVFGTVFLVLHFVDDYKQYGLIKVILLTVCGAVIAAIIYHFSQVLFRKRGTDVDGRDQKDH